MAEANIGPLVVKLQELAVSESRALVAVNDDIRSLRDKLMWMQAFLRDADPRRRIVPDEASRVWLHQTRDAAFDAEDAVDQYFLLVDLSRYILHTYIHHEKDRTIVSVVARVLKTTAYI
ncbi:putative disease resistance protein At1g50180 [Miscanthus floridulus]|uniref:putative disease resistance protein At1g50180 n=1 Tax=Miscanthus floridulus TaxID=154761 RepID=UPI00345A6BA8